MIQLLKHCGRLNDLKDSACPRQETIKDMTGAMIERIAVLVQSLSRIQIFATLWTAPHHIPLSSTISQNLLKFMSTELMMLSNHLIFCCPLLLLPSVFPNITVFPNESVLSISWPKYWHFSFSISPSNEYSGLISFRMDWFDLLEVQGSLKSLLWDHNSKASRNSFLFGISSRRYYRSSQNRSTPASSASVTGI